MCAYSPTCSVSAINLPNFLTHSNTNTSVGLIVISKLIRHHSKAMLEQGTSLFTSAGVESEGLSEGQSKVVQVRLPEGVRRDRDYIRIHTRTSCFTLLIHAKLNMITSVGNNTNSCAIIGLYVFMFWYGSTFHKEAGCHGCYAHLFGSRSSTLTAEAPRTKLVPPLLCAFPLRYPTIQPQQQRHPSAYLDVLRTKA